MIRLAHLSDLHFFKLHFSLSQFLSKEWLANLFLLLSRKKTLSPHLLSSLPTLLNSLKVSHTLVTGDLTSTSSFQEFEEASHFFNPLRQRGINLLFLPGNHDVYTKKAGIENRFYNFFSNPFNNPDELSSNFLLRRERVEAHTLSSKWVLLLIDAAYPSSLFSSRGYFKEEIEKNLLSLLSLLPSSISIIAACHFSISTMPIQKILRRKEALKAILKNDSRIKIYLHGHSHKNKIEIPQDNNFPIIIETGSAALLKEANFHILNLYDDNTIQIEAYHGFNQTYKKTLEKTLKARE